MTWLDSLVGKAVVVKFGGNAMLNSDLVADFAEDISIMRKLGIRVVVVHEGGPQISAALDAAGIEPEFVDGLRVTTEQALPIIREVLMEEISKPLAALISETGENAIALNGITEDLFLAEVTRPDLGSVGEVFAVRDGFLRELLTKGIVPVISSIAPDEDGRLVNVNADLAAASVAAALEAQELIFLTDVDGLYENYSDKSSLRTTITVSELEELLPSLEKGMIPKVSAAITASFAGVRSVRIINGSISHSIQKLNDNPSGFGTRVER